LLFFKEMAQAQAQEPVEEPAVDDVIPELVVKEGEDIDYRVVLAAYLLADLGGLDDVLLHHIP
jgi:hypothetical protein